MGTIGPIPSFTWLIFTTSIDIQHVNSQKFHNKVPTFSKLTVTFGKLKIDVGMILRVIKTQLKNSIKFDILIIINQRGSQYISRLCSLNFARCRYHRESKRQRMHVSTRRLGLKEREMAKVTISGWIVKTREIIVSSDVLRNWEWTLRNRTPT